MDIITEAPPKINQWHAWKLENIKIVKHFAIAALGNAKLRKRYERMKDCAKKIQYSVDNEGKFHYEGAWLCRDRLCPICAWRLSVKRMGEMMKTIDRLFEEYPNSHAIHIVLTVRNCSAEELRSTLRQITEGFTRLKKRQLWTDYIKGYARSVEVTYNKTDDTYHPHIHVVAIVPNHYTRQISMGDWVDMWRDSVRINYNPVVWANRTYTKNNIKLSFEYEYDPKKSNNDAAKSALIEGCKYAIKPESLTAIAEAADLNTIAEALNGIRMVSYGGIIKQIRKELKFKDKDTPDDQLPKMSIDPSQAKGQFIVLYEWCSRTRSYINVSSTKCSTNVL